MADNVVDFASMKRKKGDKEAPTKNTTPSQTAKLRTNNEVFQDVFDEVIGEWQVYATRNRLNEFIHSKLPAKARMESGADYLNDLNVISAVEQKLEMRVVMLYPGATLSNPYGWLVSFHVGKNVYSTSPDMASESSARALAVLLFLKFQWTMETLGRSLS